MALTDFGDVPANSVLPIFWTSHDAVTGANEAMSALAVGDILIYKGVSITQRSSTAGFALIDTDGIDVDTLTGVNAISIDLSDNTDAGFYAVGSFYTVILGPVTIDAQTVYVNLATFRIVAAESVAGVPEVDLTHVAGATTNVAALATNVDAILTDTAVIGAAGAGLTAIPVISGALTEGYAADGATATLAQILYMIYSCVAQMDLTGTTLTTRKLDGTTVALTFTLDSSTLPTSRVRTL